MADRVDQMAALLEDPVIVRLAQLVRISGVELGKFRRLRGNAELEELVGVFEALQSEGLEAIGERLRIFDLTLFELLTVLEDPDIKQILELRYALRSAIEELTENTDERIGRYIEELRTADAELSPELRAFLTVHELRRRLGHAPGGVDNLAR